MLKYAPIAQVSVCMVFSPWSGTLAAQCWRNQEQGRDGARGNVCLVNVHLKVGIIKK